MIDALIRWSLHNKLIVLTLAAIVLAWGGWQAVRLPVDVLPDLTAPTVTILAEGGGIAPEEMESRARDFYEEMNRRRSVREFSDRPVPRRLIEQAIMTASTAPSGAHRQPWRFVAVDDPAIKKQIRIAAEEEERQSYEGGRMPPEWIEALAPLSSLPTVTLSSLTNG